LPIILTLAAVLQLAPVSIVWTESSYVSNERLDFTITKAELQRQPRWSELHDDPPLAPRQAVHSAEGQLRLIFTNGADWRLSTVLLRPSAVTDVWIYVIEFDEMPPLPPSSAGGGVAGSRLVQHVRIPVLMDGTAVQPTRRPWPEK
jgi:hypothetical protein